MSDHEVLDILESFGDDETVLSDQDYRQALRQFAKASGLSNRAEGNEPLSDEEPEPFV